jgi:hypothetical protein
MKELRATRVVIIDDVECEGEMLRCALARNGIPSLVFSRYEDLPSEGFTGVRLAALDADFRGTFTTAPSVDAITAPTADMLARLLAAGNGPYHALIWTKHPDLAESLRGHLEERNIPPIATTTLAKESVRDGEGWNIPQIFDRVAASREKFPGLRFLSEWEGSVYDAGVITVNDLLEGDSDTGALETLASLERPRADSEIRLRAVADSLSRLHADALERAPSRFTPETIESLFGKSIQRPDGGRAAELNSRLLIRHGERGAAPGCIYKLESIANQLESPDWLPNFETIVVDFGGDADLIRGSNAIPLAVEVTPLCDEHRETRLARFLAGVAVPVGSLSETKKKRFNSPGRPAFRHFGPLTMPGLGAIDVSWCSRLLFTLPLKRIEALDPVARLRHDVLVDLQSWCSAQASRPGYLSIRA